MTRSLKLAQDEDTCECCSCLQRKKKWWKSKWSKVRCSEANSFDGQTSTSFVARPTVAWFCWLWHKMRWLKGERKRYFWLRTKLHWQRKRRYKMNRFDETIWFNQLTQIVNDDGARKLAAQVCRSQQSAGHDHAEQTAILKTKSIASLSEPNAFFNVIFQVPTQFGCAKHLWVYRRPSAKSEKKTFMKYVK